MAKLKVYRTAIGFHDAYVAAPSMKAALNAWGADSNIFSQGLAELVTDDALTKEPLTRPGEVIKKLRGTADEHMKELEKTAPPKGKRRIPGKPPPAKAAKPKPKRDELDAAEKAIEDANTRHVSEKADIVKREASLKAERRRLEKTQSAEIEALEAKRDDAHGNYRDALDQWRS